MSSKQNNDAKASKIFWDNLRDVTKYSQSSTVYLLKEMGFNSSSSFKAIQLNLMSTNEVIDEMEAFISSLDPASPHLKALNIPPDSRINYKLKPGQRACIFSTIDSIINKISAPTSQPTASRRQRQQSDAHDPELDLLHLQPFVNKHFVPLAKKHGYGFDEFPIVASSTESFPYLVVVECPLCFSPVKTRISVDVKHGKKYLNYRKTEFNKHFISCVRADRGNGTEDEEEIAET